jgi:FkbM family methyltransferase
MAHTAIGKKYVLGYNNKHNKNLPFMENIQKYKSLSKPYAIIAFYLLILSNAIFVEQPSDFIFFGLLFLYIVLAIFYKLKSNITFLLCLILLGIMYCEFLLYGPAQKTEKSSVWIFLFLIVGIVQQWIETKDEKSGEGKTDLLVKAILSVFTFKNWWLIYLDYFNRLGRKNLTYKLYGGITFAAKAGDADGLIINEIWGSKIYITDSLHINEKDTVVDIGAHKGYFSVFAAKRAKKGNVYSFEPTEKNFTFLEKNISLNHCKNIHPYKLGVAAERSERKIYEYSDQAGGISLIKEWFGDSKHVKSYKIKCITMDDIFTRCKIDKINFLKLDCEGSEHEILLNTSSKTMKKIEKIGMEYHEIGKLTAEGLITFLQKNGFTVKRKRLQTSIGLLYATR